MIFAVLAAAILGIVQPPTPAPGPSGTTEVEASVMKRLEEIDGRAAKITDLTADFEQKKITPLLKKPLTSSGKVRVKGGTVRWDTQRPEPSVMRIDDKELKLFYPSQKVLEIYPLGEDMRQMTASPLPRLAAIKAQFSIQVVPVKELDPQADASKFIALLLTPTAAALREHVAHVKVLLDVDAAVATRMEMTDPDGERTVISFTRVQANSGVDEKELELKIPEGVKITRPLDGIAPGGDNR